MNPKNRKRSLGQNGEFSAVGTRLVSYCGDASRVTVPDGITEIASRAFRDAKGVRSVEIGGNVTRICESAFYGCQSLCEVTVGEGVTEIEKDAFRDCESLRKVTLNAKLTRIAEGTFQRCTALEEITVPEGVTEIGFCAFEGCTALVRVGLPKSLVRICEEAFGGCSALRAVDLPDGLTELGKFAFSDCHRLAEIALPAALKVLGGCAFQRCAALTELTIPAGIGEIPRYLFEDATALRTVTLLGLPKTVHRSAFLGCRSFSPYCEGGIAYLGSTEHPYHVLLTAEPRDAETVSVHPDCRVVAAGAFENCDKLTALTLPEGIERIEDATFFGCSALKTLNLPKSLRSHSIDPIGPACVLDHFEASGLPDLYDLFWAYTPPKRIVALNKTVTERRFRESFGGTAARMVSALLCGFAYATEHGYEIDGETKAAYRDLISREWETAFELLTTDASVCRLLIGEELPDREATDRALDATEDLEIRALLIAYKQRRFGGGGTLFLGGD